MKKTINENEETATITISIDGLCDLMGFVGKHFVKDVNGGLSLKEIELLSDYCAMLCCFLESMSEEKMNDILNEYKEENK